MIASELVFDANAFRFFHYLLICRLQFFFEQLPFVQRGVLAIERDKLVMRSAFDDAAFVQHADKVGVADGRDAMRNDQGRAVEPDVTQVFQDRFLGVRINGRKRIIEYQNTRIAHNGTGYRRSLLLPAGKCDAAFAHKLLVLVRKFLDVFGQPGDLGGLFDGYRFTAETRSRRGRQTRGGRHG